MVRLELVMFFAYVVNPAMRSQMAKAAPGHRIKLYTSRQTDGLPVAALFCVYLQGLLRKHFLRRR